MASGTGKDRKKGRGPRSSPGAATSAVVAAAGLGFLSDVLDDVGTKGKETGNKLYAGFEKPKGGVAEFLFGPGNTMQADLDRAISQLNAGAFGNFGADIDQAFGGSSFTKGLDNVAKLEAQLADLAKRSPAVAFRALDDIVNRTNRSLGDITSVLPKTNAQLRGTAQAAGGIGGLLAQTVVPNFRAYQQVLRGMPEEVVTRVAEKGADLSRRNVLRLVEQYDLTPRQVRTFMGLVGDGPTRQKLKAVQAQIAITDGLKAFPFIGQQGAEKTRGEVRSVFSGVQVLGRAKATPRIDQQGAGDALSQMSAVSRSLTALNGMTANTYIRTIRVGVSNSAASPDVAAYGGIWQNNVRAFAQGGFGDVANRHQPELAGPGMTRIWREPETQGEAYIPLANDDRRPRARAIAAETVSLLGGVATFAKGGSVYGATARTQQALQPSPVSVNIAGARLILETDLGPLMATVADNVVAEHREMDDMLVRAGHGNSGSEVW